MNESKVTYVAWERDRIMEYLTTYSIPRNLASDILEIQKLLKRADIICAGYKVESPDKVASLDKYSIYSYLQQKDIFDIPTHALIDRNIITDIISLVNGKEINEPSEPIRLSAALMAFLQCSNIIIEPNISLYEYASLLGSNIANDELSQFRLADNIHSKIYIDIALNRKNKITEHNKNDVAVKKPDKRIDLETKPKYWAVNYTLSLKIALLELEPLKSKEKLTTFIKWMSQEFYFGAVANLFAIIYFSSSRSSKMIKDIRHNDRERALAGVKNCTWDFILLTQWSRHVINQETTKTAWLLCSRDKLVMEIASMLVVFGEDSDTEKIVKKQYRTYWGDKMGDEIYQIYSDCCKSILSKKINKNHSVDSLNDLMLKLEKEFLSWQKDSKL